MEQEQKSQGIQSQNPLLEEAKKMYHCANCDFEFFWSPTVVQEKVYCCTGCAAGGPCNCDYSLYRSVMNAAFLPGAGS